ncbi:transcription termination factor NusA [Candidatus Shapirobacteria bacterium]|nr:transcription termination factor NusA [Candidatus Shapirobacteria bacterium]HQI13103.1 transcription termination factor NusA [Candidatus Woesebacteria bacterium]
MDIKKLPKTEFAAAVAQISGERNINPQEILDAIEQGLVSAYKRDQKEHGIIVDEETQFEVELAPESGSFSIFEIDGEKRKNVTPPGFGRIAAMTAKQVIDQKIHEIERDTIISEYEKKLNTLTLGVILRIDPYKITAGIGKTEGIYPKEEQIKNESLHLGDKKLFLIKEIRTDEVTDRKDIILSRNDEDFIKLLFAREVPEVGNRTVKIEKIARDSGQRTKVAVSSTQNGIDPVGSCIGQKGSRIQSILNELPPEEKVDVIAFSKNKAQLVANALSPAENANVIEIKDSIAIVEVPEDQLALAIGSGGENVRLAGILTEVDIKVSAAKE